MKSLLSAARGSERIVLGGGNRTNGFLVALYDSFFPEFGNDPFPAGKLRRKISEQFVRGCFEVGKEPRNRNLSDREVVGSRLTSLGYVELLPHPDYKVRITELGSKRAKELIASVEAEKETKHG